jgi:mannose-6-phosphate isomerase-like protein (cupin superfamily)
MLASMSGPVAVIDIPTDGVAYRFEGRDHGAGVSFFITRFPSGEGPRLHRHPYEETFIIEDGSATFEIAGETVQAGAGQIAVVPAEAAHRFEATGERLLRAVTIQPAPEMQQEFL